MRKTLDPVRTLQCAGFLLRTSLAKRGGSLRHESPRFMRFGRRSAPAVIARMRVVRFVATYGLESGAVGRRNPSGGYSGSRARTYAVDTRPGIISGRVISGAANSMTKPNEYRKTYILSEDVSYSAATVLRKGTHASDGTLERGRVVWLENDPQAAGEVPAYAEGVGLVLVTASSVQPAG